jgi:hypothetical protein
MVPGLNDLPDDLTIPPETMLWRRLWLVITTTKGGGRRVVSNTSFKDDDEENPMSVVIATPGRDPREILGQASIGADKDPSDFAVVGFTVELARSLGLRVAPCRTPDEEHHAYLIGEKTTHVKKTLRTQCQVLVPAANYPDVDLD